MSSLIEDAAYALAERNKRIAELEDAYHDERLRADRLFDELEAERDYNKTNEDAFRSMESELSRYRTAQYQQITEIAELRQAAHEAISVLMEGLEYEIVEAK